MGKLSVVISLWVSFSYVSSYNYQDLAAWNRQSAVCGNGKLQSPIDLVGTAQTKTGLPLTLKNYSGKLTNAKIKNTGNNVKITGNWGSNNPSVTGALVNNAVYLLGEVHPHWSDKDSSGTEHSFDGKRYACEMHFVNYNSKYKDVNDAVSHNDGLLVIGLLFQVDVKSSHPGLDAFSKLATTVTAINATSTGTLDLSLFGLESLKSYYKYVGSATSPPCSEGLHWVVSNEILPVSADTIKAIRSVKLKDNDNHNVRPIQSTNGREVVLYKK